MRIRAFPRSFWLRMQRVNRHVAALVRQGKGPRAMILLLTTRGRVSGRAHVTPLQFEEVDGLFYVASARGVQADWFRNIVADPAVLVEVQGKRFAAVAEPVSDPARVADFLALRLRRHPVMVRTIMWVEGLPLHHSRQDLEIFAQEKAMVLLRPVAETQT